ncbi:hypothetical protein [Bradyrhizobium uaiense]|uniref:DUF664 domain-containing protein n=1 Tax=Bradyrhizobium uaiense TaxID=2594946 RepID=A0A6P1B8I4_9BRAD|nr:hypothetical protein [Bradyrhizobium uaiense]NEU94837.1 hypothetical protein [Bradyrhizobium uaiense]
MNMLVSSAALTAGSTVVAAVPAATRAHPALRAMPFDPIFAAIEAHQRACVNLERHLSYQGDLESEIPREKRQSSYNVWDGLTIVASDDPRWMAAERRTQELSGAEDDATLDLVQIAPTTLAGVAALMKHVADCEKKGTEWPTYDEDGCDMTFDNLLHRNIADLFSSVVG